VLLVQLRIVIGHRRSGRTAAVDEEIHDQ
jgi:hypothetical protein